MPETTLPSPGKKTPTTVSKTSASKVYDVAIVGSGIGGSILAAILARSGKTVALIERGVHPRFAIGESVVPEFAFRAKMLAATYDVPELAMMSNFQLIRHQIGPRSGIKRNFTFFSQRDGVESDQDSFRQFQTLTYPLGPDSHLYRADLDEWLTHVAIKYGAEYRERTSVDDVDIGADEVRLQTSGGPVRAKFVVDASGGRSPVSQKLAQRRHDPGFETDSRSIFTHMVGVRPLQDALGERLSFPSPPDQGTLHHTFDHGWFWVIPFNNHSNAVNPLCSVGLTLDRRYYPHNDLSAEEEFRQFADRFPVVKRQFEQARSVRTWVKTGRIQYRSDALAGDRWMVMPHAASFVDPLFSSGLVATLAGIHDAADALLHASSEGVLSAEKAAMMASSANSNLETVDHIVHGAYLSFRSPRVFNAWFRIWASCNYQASLGLIRVYLKYLGCRTADVLREIDDPIYRRVLGHGHPRVKQLIEDSYAVMRRFDAGELDDDAAVDALFGLLAGADWIPPQFRIADQKRNDLGSFTFLPMMRIVIWGKFRGPRDMRETHYDVGKMYFVELVRSIGREASRSAANFWRVFRDAWSANWRA